MVHFKSIAFLVALGLNNVAAQDQLFTTPTTLWTNQIIPGESSDVGVLKGNGCKVTPDGAHLIVTSLGGTVTSFNSMTGLLEWDYFPAPLTDGIVRSHSQVVFTTPNAVTPPYMVYSIVENENSAEAIGRVIALDMDGMELWSSVALEGVPAGSPLVSDDGSYVYLVHNANFKTVGFFTALDAADGAVFYSNSDATTPFSPPGIYHTPFEGNYGAEQGRGNTNDMIMWSATPKPEDTSINDGNTYGFQLPIAVAGNTSAVGYFVLGDTPRTFQAITAPTLTNQGLSAYLSTSRSGFYAWVGNPTNARGRFDGGAVTFGFDRNPTFPGQPVFASPVVSNGVASTPDQPFVFGGTASTQFVRMNFDLSVQTIVDTTSFIQAEARVDPLDRAVYFVEEVGVVHQVAFDTIQDIWTFNLTGGVEGEMALNSRGYVLYVATTTGLVTALQLSEIPITPSPTASPTVNVTDSPTLAPVVETLSPTPSPSASATPPDDTPVPTAADVDGGEAAPTPEPTTAPETAAAPTTTAPEPPADGASQPMILLSLFSMALFLFL